MTLTGSNDGILEKEKIIDCRTSGEKKSYYGIFIDERFRLNKRGFMKIDKKISNDKIFKKEIKISTETLEFLGKAREKIPTEQDYIKSLVENF